MSKKVMVLAHSRPAGSEDKIVRVPFGKDREYAWHPNGVLVRGRTPREAIQHSLFHEIARLGWSTNKLKVRSYGNPPTYFVNIGYLRGLDPDALYAVLKGLPNKCGHKKIFAAIQKLPEQVERPVLSEAAK
jgi:hypothetical protein